MPEKTNSQLAHNAFRKLVKEKPLTKSQLDHMAGIRKKEREQAKVRKLEREKNKVK
jgi:hypothetical protein